MWVFFGNRADGLHRIRRQTRTDNLEPIDILGISDSESAFRLQLLARTPAGRGRVWLQMEVKPAGTPFDGTGLETGPPAYTGFPAGEATP